MRHRSKELFLKMEKVWYVVFCILSTEIPLIQMGPLANHHPWYLTPGP